MGQEEGYKGVFMYTYIHPPSPPKSNPRIHKPQSAIKFSTNIQPIFGVYKTIFKLLPTNSTELENPVGDTVVDNVSEQANKV